MKEFPKRYMAAETGAGFGGAATAEPSTNSATEAVAKAPAGETPTGDQSRRDAGAPDAGGTPALPGGLTADEVEQRAYAATQRAIRDERDAEAQKAQEARAKQPEQQRRAAALPNPVVDAMDAIDLRTDMYEEALALHPDLPQESRDQIKRDLRSFKTVESL